MHHQNTPGSWYSPLFAWQGAAQSPSFVSSHQGTAAAFKNVGREDMSKGAPIGLLRRTSLPASLQLGHTLPAASNLEMQFECKKIVMAFLATPAHVSTAVKEGTIRRLASYLRQNSSAGEEGTTIWPRREGEAEMGGKTREGDRGDESP